MSVQQKTANGWKRCDGIQLNNYSTSEQMIGVWLNKPLYRKIFVVNNFNAINISNLNVDDIVNISGTCLRSTQYVNQYKPLQYRTEAPTYSDYGIQVEVRDKNSIYLASYGYEPTEFTKINIILEYTKVGD